MPKQDIIVIGASGGGVEALQVVAAGLPEDLQAAVFVVLHIGKGIDGKSVLPEILMRAGPLPAKHPADGEQIRQGHIYIAPPDYHMLVRCEHAHLVLGPKENRARPAINPLFRSAAATYGARVTGVILTGSLDDGVAGLAEIKRRGGVAIVQDPATALFPSMPRCALEHVGPDHVVPLEQIAPLISKLAATERAAAAKEEAMERNLLELTCPECRGPLWEERQGPIIEYRCRIGHAYSALALAQEHDDMVERTLWSAAVALEEAADISEKLAPELGANAAERVRKKREQLAVIRKMIGDSALK